MQSQNITLYSLGFLNIKSYIFATAFVVGNILLPQLCHLTPQGGLVWLPIYFFTLIGGYKYGWRVGVLTALLSPILNHLIFGMPPLAVLPLILIKSVILAFVAGFASNRLSRLPLVVSLALVVASYQILGTLAEWAILSDMYRALQDFRIGVAGMMVQIFGGAAIIGRFMRN